MCYICLPGLPHMQDVNLGVSTNAAGAVMVPLPAAAATHSTLATLMAYNDATATAATSAAPHTENTSAILQLSKEVWRTLCQTVLKAVSMAPNTRGPLAHIHIPSKSHSNFNQRARFQSRQPSSRQPCWSSYALPKKGVEQESTTKHMLQHCGTHTARLRMMRG
jgi:hypothetical protein